MEDSLALRTELDFSVEWKQTLPRTTHQARRSTTVAVLQGRREEEREKIYQSVPHNNNNTGLCMRLYCIAGKIGGKLNLAVYNNITPPN